LKLDFRKNYCKYSDRDGDITDDMKDEYNFSKAERSRFFRPGAKLVAPPPKSAPEPLPKGNVYDTK
jgi:hypothetical protein